MTNQSSDNNERIAKNVLLQIYKINYYVNIKQNNIKLVGD